MIFLLLNYIQENVGCFPVKCVLFSEHGLLDTYRISFQILMVWACKHIADDPTSSTAYSNGGSSEMAYLTIAWANIVHKDFAIDAASLRYVSVDHIIDFDGGVEVRI